GILGGSGDIGLGRQLLSQNTAALPYIEQGRKPARIAVLVIGQSQFPLSLHGLNVVEVAQRLVPMPPLLPLPLPIVALRIAVVLALKVAAMGMLIQFMFGVGQHPRGVVPGRCPGFGMAEILLPIAFRFRDGPVLAGVAFD